jgi:hypothetical protein
MLLLPVVDLLTKKRARVHAVHASCSTSDVWAHLLCSPGPCCLSPGISHFIHTKSCLLHFCRSLVTSPTQSLAGFAHVNQLALHTSPACFNGASHFWPLSNETRLCGMQGALVKSHPGSCPAKSSLTGAHLEVDEAALKAAMPLAPGHRCGMFLFTHTHTRARTHTTKIRVCTVLPSFPIFSPTQYKQYSV